MMYSFFIISIPSSRKSNLHCNVLLSKILQKVEFDEGRFSYEPLDNAYHVYFRDCIEARDRKVHANQQGLS